MFTGIVERTGRISVTRAVPGGRRLRVTVGPSARQSDIGASVAVNGVCLTVAAIGDDWLEFDVITETLEKTTLGSKQTGDPVNIERSLRAGDRLDGHFVQGHADGTAKIKRIDSSPKECVIWLDPQAHLLPCIVPKGSVAIDGVSLTIAAVRDASFSVALIPTTLDLTTLSDLSAGDTVNIETDILTRTIVHHLSNLAESGGLTIDGLRQAGFA